MSPGFGGSQFLGGTALGAGATMGSSGQGGNGGNNGGGGGGGYYGGGGGTEGGGGGGSSYYAPTALSGTLTVGIANTPPGQGDIDYLATAARGGLANGVGGNGFVVLAWR